VVSLHPSSCSWLCLTLFSSTDPPATEIYTLSLHDALPILPRPGAGACRPGAGGCPCAAAAGLRRRDPGSATAGRAAAGRRRHPRSEEHTSELQSRENLVCRLLLEKKKLHQIYGQRR